MLFARASTVGFTAARVGQGGLRTSGSSATNARTGARVRETWPTCPCFDGRETGRPLRSSLYQGTIMEQSYNMLRAKSIGRASIALCAITLLSGQAAKAQATLFNIPSTDTVAKKKTYLE